MKRYQTRTCAECPWLKSVEPGQFPPERFIALAHTAYDMAVPQFACHKSPPGQEFGCAGFVLAGSTHNMGARMAARRGVLDRAATTATGPLYRNYREMAIAHGVPPRHPALRRCRDDQ